MPHQPIRALALDEHRGTARPGASSTQPTFLNPRDKRSLSSSTKQERSQKRIRNVSKIASAFSPRPASRTRAGSAFTPAMEPFESSNETCSSSFAPRPQSASETSPAPGLSRGCGGGCPSEHRSGLPPLGTSPSTPSVGGSPPFDGGPRRPLRAVLSDGLFCSARFRFPGLPRPARRPAHHMTSLPAGILPAELPKDPQPPRHGNRRQGY